jgi:hypothetical protein
VSSEEKGPQTSYLNGDGGDGDAAVGKKSGFSVGEIDGEKGEREEWEGSYTP